MVSVYVSKLGKT